MAVGGLSTELNKVQRTMYASHIRGDIHFNILSPQIPTAKEGELFELILPDGK